jgi:hypothetical protein
MAKRVHSIERTREQGSGPKGNAGFDDSSADLISLARCRELLGAEAEDLSDNQVDLIRRHADAVAHVVVEAFRENRPTDG